VTNAAVQEKSRNSSKIIRIERPRFLREAIEHREGGANSADLLLPGHRNRKSARLTGYAMRLGQRDLPPLPHIDIASAEAFCHCWANCIQN
jgi:hypothetical protein